MASTTTETPFNNYSEALLLATSIAKLMPSFICLIFTIATCIPFTFASKFNNKGIKKLIRATVILYFTLYLIQMSLFGIDGIGDDYQLYRYDQQFDIIFDTVVIALHILGHVVFYVYLMERLFILFTETQYAVQPLTFKILVILAINIEIYHFCIHIVYEYDLFEHYNEDYHIHLLLLGLFVVMNISFALSLIGLFVNKLFLIIVSQRLSISMTTLMRSNTSDIDSIREEEFSLDDKQRNMVQTITKNCVLIISAIIWRNVSVIFLSIVLHRDEEKLSWIGVIIWISYSVALFIELISVYLTFSFANKAYKILCGGIHKCCYRYCQQCAKSKTMKADQMKIDSYVAMSEFDDPL